MVNSHWGGLWKTLWNEGNLRGTEYGKVEDKERAFLGQVQHKQGHGGQNVQVVLEDGAAEGSHCGAVVGNVENCGRCFQNWGLWSTSPMRR